MATEAKKTAINQGKEMVNNTRRKIREIRERAAAAEYGYRHTQVI